MGMGMGIGMGTESNGICKDRIDRDKKGRDGLNKG